ncbi:nuclear mitotic apparatus protein 1 [Hypanus sabinus]|uniref:nuclear mitotic apparatus protein 1 n=1 Tax=Hypanus sabinus TaxID=79690 RepID=UPI0028C49000|nr:nuclear mitotic apparatus protein 1 [Hypanus sabinus]XP_059819573.1 nuclear mitotic apparatus protein 1 [Hypanus sabinus]
MAVHRTKADALVKWINSLKLSEEIGGLAALQDCAVFVSIVCKISGKENASQVLETKSMEERFQFICDFLECAEAQENQPDRCRYSPVAGNLVSLQKILRGEEVELEMAKMAVLLLHLHTMARHNPREFDDLDTETQGELVGMLRYMMDNEDAIHLDNNLATFLQSRASSPLAHLHSPGSDEVISPMFCGKAGGQKTQFLSSKVYSCGPSSPTSPMRDFMQTPQVQARRMKKQLADARMLRNDLEIELTEARKLITEKETEVSILQQKIDRLVKLTERQATEEQPDELGNLREKYESLLNRLRDTQKQSQDMKTEKSQMERKIDKLEEENGNLSYKVRDLGNRLTQSQKALNELADEHESAMPIWEGKQKQLESDLFVALSDKKLMEERIQILEGKISLMEDKLAAAGESSSEVKGEVIGDVLQLEALKLEVSQLTAKAAELEQETTLHKEEKSHLAETVSSLKQSMAELMEQKKVLEQEARVQEEQLLGQLDTLNVEVIKTNNSLMQKELELEEEKRLRHQLAEDSQNKEQAVLDLRSKLESLGETLQVKEETLQAFEQRLEAERESTLQQMTALKQESERICSEKVSVVTQYEALKVEKESEMERLNRQIQLLESNHVGIESLERERNELMEKVQMLDTQVAEMTSENQNLQTACSAHKQSHSEEVAALKAELQETREELEGHKIKLVGLADAAQNNEALREQLASLQSAVEGLEGEKRQWEEARVSEAEQRCQLTQELKGLREERDGAKAQLSEQLKLQELAQATAKQSMDEQLERSAELQSELSNALKMVEEREKEEEKFRKEAASWKEKFEAARQQEAELDRAVADLKEAREKAEAELSEEREKIGQLEGRLAKLEAGQEGKVSVPESEFSQLRAAAALEAEARAEAASWRQKLEAAKNEASERLSQAEEKTRKSSAELEQACRELTEARAGLEEYKGRLSELEAKLDGAQRAASEEEAFRGQLGVLRAELQDLRKAERERQEESAATVSQLEAERARRAELQQTVDRQQEQLEAAKAKAATQESELARYAQAFSEREGELAELSSKIAASEEAGRRAGRRAEAAEQELRSSLSLRQEREADLEALRSRMAQLEGECNGKQSELARLEAELQAQIQGLLQEKEATEQARSHELGLQREELEQERKKVHTLELEVSAWQDKLTGEQKESARLKEEMNLAKETEGRLQKELEALQEEQARQRDSAARLQDEEVATQKQTIQALQEQLASGNRLVVELEQRARAEQENMSQKEAELAHLRGEVAKAQCQLSEAESQRRAEVERLERQLGELRADAGQLKAAQERCQQQQQEIQQLQQTSSQLAATRGKLETELAEARETHAKQLSLLTAQHVDDQAASRQREDESRRRIEEVTSKYEKAKAKVLEDKRKFQEEREQLIAQVSDLNEKLSQHDMASKTKLQKLVARDNETQEKLEQQVMELKTQLKEKEEIVQHVKAQLEKAKTHYDSKKMLNLELAEKLEAREKSISTLEQQLTVAKEEGAELRAESERLRQEAQQAVREAKEANLKNKALSAQVEFADQQLRELNKSHLPVGTRRSRSNVGRAATQAGDSEADFSQDSIELSDLEEQAAAWNNTRARRGRTGYKTSDVTPEGNQSLATQKLRGKLDSLESLYFTPLPDRGQSKMDTSLSSLGDLSLDSAKKTRSGRRRTTQVINILMTKKQTVDYEEPSTSASTLSIQPSASQTDVSGQLSRSRWRNRASSTTSLATVNRSESQDPLDASSSSEDVGTAALKNLPGFRPTTRRSSRLSMFGTAASSSNALYPGSCQDEPDQMDDWNRIAELQRRNGVCPPHLKTSYPVESRTAITESVITEDELKLGDPNETLRRATLLPKEISALRLRNLAADSLDPNWKGVTTRQRKRLSEESHQGSGTPEAKKQLSCFPRPSSPKEKDKQDQSQYESRSKRPAQNKGRSQDDRRKTISYTVFNTPRKLSSTLLRGISKRATPRKTPKKTQKKSPRKSPRSNSKKDAGKRKYSRNKM